MPKFGFLMFPKSMEIVGVCPGTNVITGTSNPDDMPALAARRKEIHRFKTDEEWAAIRAEWAETIDKHAIFLGVDPDDIRLVDADAYVAEAV